MDKFNGERKELVSKMEKMASEIINKESLVTTLEN